MSTAISIFLLFMFSIAIFFFGVWYGARAATKELMDILEKALYESSLTKVQILGLIRKLQENTRK